MNGSHSPTPDATWTARAWGGIAGYETGGFSGLVKGQGNKDSELAFLTPGEFVIPTRGTEGFSMLSSLRSLAARLWARLAPQGGRA